MDLNGKFILIKNYKEQIPVELILNALGIFHYNGMFGKDISESEPNYYSKACIGVINKAYGYYDTKDSVYNSEDSMSFKEFLDLGL